MEFKETLSIIIALANLLGMIIIAYKAFAQPTEKNADDVRLLSQGCEYKHKALDNQIDTISKNLSFLRENHINHIETDIKALQEGQVKIFTILDERLPKK